MIVETHSHISMPLEGDLPEWTAYGKSLDGVESYVRGYRENGVDACWVFGTHSWRNASLVKAENDALSTLIDRDPDFFFPFGTVNPFWPKSAIKEEIDRITTELKLYGLKFAPVVKGCSLASPGMDAVAKAAAGHDLPVFLHDGSAEYCSPTQVIAFARRHPNLRVVSGHSGLREFWRDFVRCAAPPPNLWYCLSGPTQLGTQALYEALGPEKLFFGSDAGLGTPVSTYAYIKRIENLNAPEEHKRMIFSENAVAFLKK